MATVLTAPVYVYSAVMNRTLASLLFVALSLVCCGSRNQPAATTPSPADETGPATGDTSTSNSPPETSDTAAAQTPPPGSELKTCGHDADCTLSVFAGCSTCCANVPHAFLN